MKRLFVLVLALMMACSLFSCDPGKKPVETKPSGTMDTAEPKDTGEKPPLSDPEETGGGEKEKCLICFDMEGNDRKCDECGSWLYEKGEAWTKEVPDNLKVTLVDYLSNYHIIEKIGDEIYIKEYLSEKDYQNKENSYETYVTMTEQRHRDEKAEGEYTDWRVNNFPVAYGDVYELFAVKVMQQLNGTSLSSKVQSALEAPSSGKETVAGKECEIKEYDGNFGVKYKVWLWNSMPLKTAQMDPNTETEYKVMFEFLEWDTSITGFSAEMPQ